MPRRADCQAGRSKDIDLVHRCGYRRFGWLRMEQASVEGTGVA